MKEKRLTIKQERFCQEYIRTGNKTEAYRIAYETSKMQPQTITRKSQELYNNGIVAARIEQLQNEIAERNKITIDELVGILANIARFDIGNLFDEYGQLKQMHQIDAATRTAISSIDQEQLFADKGQVIGNLAKIRTISKEGAIDKLMRHLGGYEKDNYQKGEVVVYTPEERQLRIQQLKQKLKND